MAWTPIAYAGAAAVDSTGNYSWFNINSLVGGGSTFVQFPNNANPFYESDKIKLTNWNITIPGGGSAVTKVRYSYYGRKVSAGADTIWLDTATGYGVTHNRYSTSNLGTSYVLYTHEYTPASFGLTATEIDNLVSDSASYGMNILAIIGTVGAGIQAYVSNIALEFEYPDAGSMMYAAK